ncbi:hypothetical protein [Borrelia sp. RT1S]|uniref:hypothetical protein n=1 Tax=Borrelia sp. RT1S TaxID=2898580 RepID=UPI001E482971|nr:hypothetical protein [Borrelia sp. RT1S]UGQ17976.1 hypothetical protein LSO05_05950 [Borrelia sp. RT1S]
MKKISSVVFLILSVVLVACSIKVTKRGGVNPSAKQDSDQGQTEEEIKAEADAVLDALKTKRDDYHNKMEDLRTKFKEKDPTKRNSVSMPGGLLGSIDREKIYASLGYDNEAIGKLNSVIGMLQLNDSVNNRDKERETVTNVLTMLVELDDATEKILDKHLTEDSLEKIKQDNKKLKRLDKELKAFTNKRNAFIKSIKTLIKEAASKADEAGVRAELDKVTNTTIGVTTPGEAGYYHSTISAIKANEINIGILVK